MVVARSVTRPPTKRDRIL